MTPPGPGSATTAAPESTGASSGTATTGSTPASPSEATTTTIPASPRSAAAAAPAAGQPGSQEAFSNMMASLMQMMVGGQVVRWQDAFNELTHYLQLLTLFPSFLPNMLLNGKHLLLLFYGMFKISWQDMQ